MKYLSLMLPVLLIGGIVAASLLDSIVWALVSLGLFILLGYVMDQQKVTLAHPDDEHHDEPHEEHRHVA